jgi:hypothetical protein
MPESISIPSEQSQSAAEPQGGRIGVAFDWGFGVQLAIQGLLILLSVPLPNGMLISPLFGLGSLGASAIAFAQGEALRRGNGLARRIQILGNSALTLGGIATLPLLVQLLAQARFGFLYTWLLLAVVSPIEVWLLMQPGSRRWYGRVDAGEARARHSGRWLSGTIAWALIGGLLQAAAAYFR